MATQKQIVAVDINMLKGAGENIRSRPPTWGSLAFVLVIHHGGDREAVSCLEHFVSVGLDRANSIDV